MRMEDDVDAPYVIDLDGDMNLDMDNHDEEEHKEEQDKEQEDEEEVVEDEEEDENEDDGKEPRMIGQGEMLNTSAHDLDTMVEDQPIVLPEQGQEMHLHTPRPQPAGPAPWPHTLERRPSPRSPEPHPLSGLKYLGHVSPQIPRPAVPTLREAEVAGNCSDEDVHQLLLRGSQGGDNLPDVPRHEVRPHVSAGEERTGSRGAAEAMGVVCGFGSGPCPVHFPCSSLSISCIDYSTCPKDFGSLSVYFIYGIHIGSILFIVIWDIMHAVFVQLRGCKDPPCDAVEVQ